MHTYQYDKKRDNVISNKDNLKSDTIFQHKEYASVRENLTLLHQNSKNANPPAYPRSLISDFVIRYLETIVVKLSPR